MMKDNVKKIICIVLALLLALSILISVFAQEEEYQWQSDLSYYRQFEGQDISINVYNWGEYLSDGSDGLMDVNKEFQKLTGIKVYYSTYATNEELYSKLKSGNANYDIIIPSDYMIGRFISEKMIKEIDTGALPNFSNIDSAFVNPFYDPSNGYSVPFTWGVVGIIYNKDMVYEDEITSWDILWDERYMGNILMFANSRDAFGIAQKKLLYSMNTTDKDELKDCLEELKKQKPLVQAYVMDEIFDKMINGEAALAPYYAGDAVGMIEQNPSLDFAVPQEGTNIFVDALCIPVSSRQSEAAMLYINFLLEPEVGVANAEFIGYASPNSEAKNLLDEEITSNPIAYPGEEVIENAEYFLELPRETSLFMDSLWTELLSTDEEYNRWFVPVFLVLAIGFMVTMNILRALKKQGKRYYHINGKR